MRCRASLWAGSPGSWWTHFGYPLFFVITSAIGIPGALLCLYVWRGTLTGRTEEEEVAAAPEPAGGTAE